MKNLPNILKKKQYQKIKIKISKTQHLRIKGKINGVKGNFILDTGASNSCIDFENTDYFQVNAQDSQNKASGAGATGMLTQTATKNKLQLGSWKQTNFNLVIFDMSHVNQALMNYKAKPVHGIIGADILIKNKAIIDYSNGYLYLKKR